MEKGIEDIVKFVFNQKVESILKIQDLGAVNEVYELKCKNIDYILRVNQDSNKDVEFLKEKWCLEKVADLEIPSPKVLKIGVRNNFPFMVQNKIEGLNGSKCTTEQKVLIWKNLGEYARKFHSIKRIEVPQVNTNEFHANWKSRLNYNIEQLVHDDTLLEKNVFSQLEHEKMKNILKQLANKKFVEGLVHGDLTPRNTIFKNQITTLLDWGTAGINVVPHTEIGTILMEKELCKNEFNAFLEGMDMRQEDYQKIEGEIKMLNLLHCLDKYRWACEYDLENIENYTTKIRSTYQEVMA